MVAAAQTFHGTVAELDHVGGPMNNRVVDREDDDYRFRTQHEPKGAIYPFGPETRVIASLLMWLVPGACFSSG